MVLIIDRKPCGTESRHHSRHTRDTLQLNTQKYKLNNTQNLSLDQLCAVVAQHAQQTDIFYLRDFFNNSIYIAVYNINIQTLIKSNIYVFISSLSTDLLLPVPYYMHMFHQHNYPQQLLLTTHAAGHLMHDTISMVNYTVIVNRYLQYLSFDSMQIKKSQELLIELLNIPNNNTFIIIKLILRLLISSYIINPQIYKDISLVYTTVFVQEIIDMYLTPIMQIYKYLQLS
jgi:hypothetical protein